MKTLNHFKLVNVALTYRCNRTCDYCYALGISDEYRDMTSEDYLELLKWFNKNNIRRFNFIGGEPTIHPKIKEFLKIGYDQGFWIGILSNGVFDIDFLSALSERNSFLINYNPSSHYSEKEYEILNKNLDAMRDRKIKFSLGFLVSDNMKSADFMIKAVKRFKPLDVKMDVIVPNSLGCNAYVSSEKYLANMAKLAEFKKQIIDLGFKVKSTRAMPKCGIKEENLSNAYSTCGSACGSVLVNPDLTIFPCVSVFFRGPKITTFEDSVNSIKEFYSKSLDKLRWEVDLFGECESCIYKFRKNCQGACLTYKCAPLRFIGHSKFNVFSNCDEEETTKFIKCFEAILSELKFKHKTFKKPKVYLFNSRDEMFFYSGVYDCPKDNHILSNNGVLYCDNPNIDSQAIAEEINKLR